MTASRRPRQSGSSVTTAAFAVASVDAAGAGLSDGDDATVELAQQVVQVDGDEVDDLARERVARRQADRLAHRLLGPRGVAAAQLRQAADVGGGVVDALGRLRVVAAMRAADAALPARPGGSGLAPGIGMPISIGVAAPRLVAGAIAATCAAYRM